MTDQHRRAWVPEAGGWIDVGDRRSLRLEWHGPPSLRPAPAEFAPLVLDLPINRYRCPVCGWEALGTSAPSCPYRAECNQKESMTTEPCRTCRHRSDEWRCDIAGNPPVPVDGKCDCYERDPVKLRLVKEPGR